MGITVSASGSIPLGSESSADRHALFDSLDEEVKRFGPLAVHRQGLTIDFTFGFLRIAPPSNPLHGIDSGRITIDASSDGQVLRYELRLTGLASVAVLGFLGIAIYVGFDPSIPSLLERVFFAVVPPLVVVTLAYANIRLSFSRFLRRIVGAASGGRAAGGAGDRIASAELPTAAVTDEVLTKVHVALPYNPHWGGESMWAQDLGDDLYELRNSPFYAYGLNFLDVVRALAPDPDKKPVVLAVVRRSGHRSVWVTFTDNADSEARAKRLELLNRWRGFFEGKDESYFVVDVEPEGDFVAVLEQLAIWRTDGILTYHTGAAGGFEPDGA